MAAWLTPRTLRRCLDCEATCSQSKDLVRRALHLCCSNVLGTACLLSPSVTRPGTSGAHRDQLLRAQRTHEADRRGVPGLCAANLSTVCSHGSARSLQALRSSSACMARDPYPHTFIFACRSAQGFTSSSCRVDAGVPLREALERLHSWLFQHGFIEPMSHSCPVTWTGWLLCGRQCVILLFVLLSHLLPVAHPHQRCFMQTGI